MGFTDVRAWERVYCTNVYDYDRVIKENILPDSPFYPEKILLPWKRIFVAQSAMIDIFYWWTKQKKYIKIISDREKKCFVNCH